jgi:hypothetical protein
MGLVNKAMGALLGSSRVASAAGEWACAMCCVKATSVRFDAYAGAMWSEVAGGVANGYLHQRSNINPTIGLSPGPRRKPKRPGFF